MTDHLPECDLSKPCDNGKPHDMNKSGWNRCYRCEAGCECERLRACEQRVLNLNPAAHDVLIAQRARERALDAAREAVGGMVIETVGNSAATVDQALAAIDALRENKK